MLNKPVYVMCESFKFVRLYPLNQQDLPDEFKVSRSGTRFAIALSSLSSMIRDTYSIEEGTVHRLRKYIRGGLQNAYAGEETSEMVMKYFLGRGVSKIVKIIIM